MLLYKKVVVFMRFLKTGSRNKQFDFKTFFLKYTTPKYHRKKCILCYGIININKNIISCDDKSFKGQMNIPPACNILFFFYLNILKFIFKG